MELVGTRLQLHVGHCPARAAEFSRIVARGYVHRLDRLRRWDVDLQQTGAFVVIDAVELQIIELSRLAVHLG